MTAPREALPRRKVLALSEVSEKCLEMRRKSRYDTAGLDAEEQDEGMHKMAMTREQMDRKMDAHFAFEARDDVEGVLSTLAPDVEHDVVGWHGGPVRGRAAARPFYEALFADLSESKVECLRRLYGEHFLIDESLWQGHAPGTPFGLRGENRSIAFRLLHVIEFAPNGDIARENVWVDLAAIIRQLS